MPAENLQEESLAKNPNLDLAQWKFKLTTEAYKNNADLVKKLREAIVENSMAPFYQEV